MCYTEEQLVQLDESSIFVIILRIPESLASFLFFTEQGSALKTRLKSEMMRILRAISATGENTERHVHSKLFVYDITTRTSNMSKSVSEIVVGSRSSFLLDKEYVVSVQLKDGVAGRTDIANSSSNAQKSLDSVSLPTILDAATKKIDRTSCGLCDKCGVFHTDPNCSILNNSIEQSDARKADAAKSNTEVDLGMEYTVRRQKSCVSSPQKGTNTPEVEVGIEFYYRRKKRQESESFSQATKCTQEPPPENTAASSKLKRSSRILEKNTKKAVLLSKTASSDEISRRRRNDSFSGTELETPERKRQKLGTPREGETPEDTEKAKQAMVLVTRIDHPDAITPINIAKKDGKEETPKSSPLETQSPPPEKSRETVEKVKQLMVTPTSNGAKKSDKEETPKSSRKKNEQESNSEIQKPRGFRSFIQSLFKF